MSQKNSDLRNGSLQADGCEGQGATHANASQPYYIMSDDSCRPLQPSTQAADDLYHVKRYDKHDPSVRPVALRVLAENIPDELTTLRQWVNWEYEFKDGRWTKVPYTPTTGYKASTTKPATWRSFAEVWAAYLTGQYDGVGFVLTAGDPYTAVDLDDCLDPDTRQFTSPKAEAITRTLNSYTEVSPSGMGVRILVRGTKTLAETRNDDIEVYDHARYVTLTGQVLEGISYED